MRHSILLFAFVLAACGGDGDPPAERKPPPPAVEEQVEPELTSRDVDRELDQLEREINDGKSDQRLLSQR